MKKASPSTWMPLPVLTRTIAALLAGAAFMIASMVGAVHAQPSMPASCAKQCKPKRGDYGPCMNRCLEPKRQSKVSASLPETKRQRAWWPVRLYQRVTGFFSRLSPEFVSGLVYAGVILVRVIGQARHNRNLRIIRRLHCRANALECQAADLRAEAQRRQYRR